MPVYQIKRLVHPETLRSVSPGSLLQGRVVYPVGPAVCPLDGPSRAEAYRESNDRCRRGQTRVVLESGTQVTKYRDGSGVVRKVGTGCRMKEAAAAVLKDLTDRAQLVKARVITPAQDAAADHATAPLSIQLDAHGAWQGAFGNRGNPVSSMHRANTDAALRRLCGEWRWERLADLTRASLEAWLELRSREGMSAARRNALLKAGVAFVNWCLDTGRLTANPFAGIDRADAEADPRRRRRALTEEELRRLLVVARLAAGSGPRPRNA